MKDRNVFVYYKTFPDQLVALKIVRRSIRQNLTGFEALIRKIARRFCSVFVVLVGVLGSYNHQSGKKYKHTSTADCRSEQKIIFMDKSKTKICTRHGCVGGCTLILKEFITTDREARYYSCVIQECRLTFD